MPKTLHIRCVRSIWVPSGLAYILSICGKPSNLLSASVNSEFEILSFEVDSWRIVLAYVRTVSKINANAFIGYLLFLILMVQLVEIRSTTSMPHFVWSYNLCISGFLCSSFVTLTSSCKVLRTIKFLLPVFFLPMYNSRRFFPSLSKTWRTDLSSLFSKILVSFGISLRYNRIAPTIVIFFSNGH